MNVDMSKYKVVNGTHYHVDTPDEVCQVLEYARERRRRLAIAYKAESQPEYGRVGRSLGPTLRVPLLVHNTRSLGGGPISTQLIVEVRDSATKELLYAAPGRETS